MKNESELRALLAEAELEARADELAALARPCVRLAGRATPDADIPAGHSRLGGAPDLPAAIPWPVWRATPLAFLGQLALRDVRGMPGTDVLPADGLLSFFYDANQTTWGFDPADAGSFAVLYVPPDEALARRPAPEGVPPHGVYASCALEAHAELSLPEGNSAAVREAGLEGEEWDAYLDMMSRQAWDAPGPRHQLLGYPHPIQNEMELECQLVTNGLYCGDRGGFEDPRAQALAPGARDWRLLLQLDSDEEAGMSWGDTGMLYFWIRDEDLRQRRFDRVWMVLQCT